MKLLTKRIGKFTPEKFHDIDPSCLYYKNIAIENDTSSDQNEARASLRIIIFGRLYKKVGTMR